MLKSNTKSGANKWAIQINIQLKIQKYLLRSQGNDGFQAKRSMKKFNMEIQLRVKLNWILQIL